MPIWSEILQELKASDPPDFDKVRREHLLKLYEHTGRDVILYASGWLQKPMSPEAALIGETDVYALMEVSQGLPGPDLDLILHSPGGSPEAAEAVVLYLRSRFSHVRVIVPYLAMSAATMIACAADEIVLGKHSFLGPTDPQFFIPTPLGRRMVPAQAVLDQFDKARRDCATAGNAAAWLPMLGQYGPDFLIRCETALDLSRELVNEWLQKYMFKNQRNGAKRAKAIAAWLAAHQNFKSHGRHIARAQLAQQGLNIICLEDDERLQDASLSVFHATTHTFAATHLAKIVENHTGRMFISDQPPPLRT